ncbi:hypothetical protein TIFTF001_030991 [Ficus carica]|uniref:Uncharacterized protein n=1 Tax=Ficus carica TaxID=3494 RepID=A0AA88J4W4_FICCA|nr:hypothetical protein TIFTF001_030991 [Ficus carica]
MGSTISDQLNTRSNPGHALSLYPSATSAYYCSTSHHHLPPHTLAEPAPAGAGDNHPPVPCAGSGPTWRQSIGPFLDRLKHRSAHGRYHTGVPITSRCFPFTGDQRRSVWPVLTGLPDHTRKLSTAKGEVEQIIVLRTNGGG